MLLYNSDININWSFIQTLYNFILVMRTFWKHKLSKANIAWSKTNLHCSSFKIWIDFAFKVVLSFDLDQSLSVHFANSSYALKHSLSWNFGLYLHQSKYVKKICELETKFFLSSTASPSSWPDFAASLRCSLSLYLSLPVISLYSFLFLFCFSSITHWCFYAHSGIGIGHTVALLHIHFRAINFIIAFYQCA